MPTQTRPDNDAVCIECGHIALHHGSHGRCEHVDRTVSPCVRCHCDAFVISREFIAVNPVEELLKAIGIVHGKGYENTWRIVLAKFELKRAAEPPMANMIGSDLVSLLDYARLLDEDPSAVDMIKKRIFSINSSLALHGIPWMRFKEFLVGMLDAPDNGVEEKDEDDLEVA
jgi:hypothetical protein